MADLVVGIKITAKDDASAVVRNIRGEIGKLTRDSGRRGRAGGRDGAAGGLVPSNTTIDLAGARLTRFSKTAASAMRSPINAAIGYESSIAEIATLTDEAKFSQKELEDTVRGANKQYGGGAGQQAAALYDIISAGATEATEAQEQLDAANKLAIGGVTDQRSAVLAISKSVANFGVSGETAADSIFAAVKRGQLTVGELTRALPKVAPVAAKAGISLQHTNAALALLSKSLPSAAESSTALRAALGNIDKPSRKARKEAERLGIDFSTTGLQAKGLEGFLVNLATNSKLKEDSFAKLFGSTRGKTAILALTKDLGELNKEINAQNDIAGAATVAAEKIGKTRGQQLKIAKANFEDLTITIGTKIAPALSDLTATALRVAQPIAAWAEANGPLVSTLAKAAAGAALYAGVLGGGLRVLAVFRDAVTSSISVIKRTGDAMNVVRKGALLAADVVAESKIGEVMGGVRKAFNTAAGPINNLTSKLGRAGLVGAAIAAGFEIGRAADRMFGISDRLAGVSSGKQGVRGGVGFKTESKRGSLIDRAEAAGASNLLQFGIQERKRVEGILNATVGEAEFGKEKERDSRINQILRDQGFKIGAVGDIRETDATLARSRERLAIAIKVDSEGRATVSSVAAPEGVGDVDIDSGAIGAVG